MKKRWKVAIAVGGVFAMGVGYAVWYAFRDGGPLPSRASLRQRWQELARKYIPEPKAGEADAWAVFGEATDERRAIDRTLWKPGAVSNRPVPDFGLIGEHAPVARSAQEWDQDELKMQLAEKSLAVKCLDEYRAQGVIAKIDLLPGIKTGRAPDILAPENEPLVNTLKPHLAQMRFFARVNGARMRLAVESGDLEEFTKALRTNTALARMSASGPTMIDRLVGIAIEALTDYAAFRALQERPQEQWLRAVEAELDRGVAAVPFAHAIQGERVWGTDGLVFAKEQGSFGPQRVAIDAFAAVTGTPALGSPGENVAELDKYYKAFEALSAVPRPERNAKAADAAAVVKAPSRFRLVGILVPAISKSIDSEDQQSMRRAAVRLSVSVERYRLQHGKLPVSLDELDAAVVKVAADPWGKSGSSLRYRLATEADKMPCGYLIYSVGFDETDNGGKAGAAGREFDALSTKGAGFDFILNRAD